MTAVRADMLRSSECSEVVLAHNPSGIPIKKLNGEALIGGYERNKVHKDWG